MKKIIPGLLITLSSLSAVAAPQTVNDFLGTYQLDQQQKTMGDTFCFSAIQIVREATGIALYRTDVTEAPMYKAPMNGLPRKTSGSHNEAGTSTSGKDQVTFKNGILKFQYSGVLKFLGIPSMKESDSYSLTLAADRNTVQAVRTTFEGLPFNVGRKSEVKCVYTKKNE